MHHRFFPKKNHFQYHSLYIAVPISRIYHLQRSLFSIDRFNLFSFYQRDYGDDKHRFTAWIDNLLLSQHITGVKEIVLVTHPRMLGYAFNPVSFWLCLNDQDQLIAVLSEVTNTAKQKHYYLCHKANLLPIHKQDYLETNKHFYVSPFMKVEGTYQFRFEITEAGINFFINYLVQDKIKLSTYLKCTYHHLNNTNLLFYFLKFPFATLKTTALIHYQAVKLALKKIAYDKYPAPLKNHLTIGKNEKKDC